MYARIECVLHLGALQRLRGEVIELVRERLQVWYLDAAALFWELHNLNISGHRVSAHVRKTSHQWHAQFLISGRVAQERKWKGKQGKKTNEKKNIRTKFKKKNFRMQWAPSLALPVVTLNFIFLHCHCKMAYHRGRSRCRIPWASLSHLWKNKKSNSKRPSQGDTIYSDRLAGFPENISWESFVGPKCHSWHFVIPDVNLIASFVWIYIILFFTKIYICNIKRLNV